MADPIPTTSMATAPTRCLTMGVKEVRGEAVPVPGVPHHHAVLYRSEMPMPKAEQATRLRVCASYQWLQKPRNEREEAALTEAAEKAAPEQGLERSLVEKWRAWHERAEATFEKATSLELAVRTKAAERPKGSRATTRTTANGANHRPGGWWGAGRGGS